MNRRVIYNYIRRIRYSSLFHHYFTAVRRKFYDGKEKLRFLPVPLFFLSLPFILDEVLMNNR